MGPFSLGDDVWAKDHLCIAIPSHLGQWTCKCWRTLRDQTQHAQHHLTSRLLSRCADQARSLSRVSGHHFAPFPSPPHHLPVRHHGPRFGPCDREMRSVFTPPLGVEMHRQSSSHFQAALPPLGLPGEIARASDPPGSPYGTLAPRGGGDIEACPSRVGWSSQPVRFASSHLVEAGIERQRGSPMYRRTVAPEESRRRTFQASALYSPALPFGTPCISS